MKKNQLTFIDESGKEVLCDIVFTFDSEEFGKSYVVFHPTLEEAPEEQIEVMAACYKPTEDGDGELYAIETDEEWQLVEDMLQKYDEEECGCGCEDCEGECDDDCDCDDDECDCGCCHHHDDK